MLAELLLVFPAQALPTSHQRPRVSMFVKSSKLTLRGVTDAPGLKKLL